jgi:hypothetical protein
MTRVQFNGRTRILTEDQAARLPQTPKTLEELETQLLQSIDRLDRGEGVDGKESLLRLRKRMNDDESPQ